MNLLLYTKLKPSGVEWLGDVPSHWGIKRLRYVCRFAYGDSLAAEDREDGPILVFGSNGAVGTHVTSNTKKPVIVVGRKGSHGKINFSEQEVFAIDTTYFIDREHTLAELRWLFYMLGSLGLDGISKDSAVPGLAREDAYAHYVVTPSADEQCFIADFLDGETAKLDTLVEKKRALIEKLKEKRAALISRTVTRGLPPAAARAAGLNPQLKLKPSGIEWLGEVPAHWVEERLRRVCLRVTDGAHISPDLSSADFPFVSTVDISSYGHVDTKGCLRTSAECYNYLVRTGCRPFRGDILFSKDGTVGRTAIVDFELDFVVASSLIILSPKANRLESRFLNYWLNNNLLQQDVLLQISGAALRRISVEKVSRLPVLLPLLPEQCAIADYLDRETTKIDRMVEKVEAAIACLQEYRSALITAAVTGKIDVRDRVAAQAGALPDIPNTV